MVYMYIVKHKYIVMFDDIHIYNLACSCCLTTQLGRNTSKCCECCQVEVPTTGRSHIQRIRTECGVSERVRETSIMRSWPSRGCCTWGGGKECEPVEKGGRGADIDVGLVARWLDYNGIYVDYNMPHFKLSV